MLIHAYVSQQGSVMSTYIAATGNCKRSWTPAAAGTKCYKNDTTLKQPYLCYTRVSEVVGNPISGISTCIFPQFILVGTLVH